MRLIDADELKRKVISWLRPTTDEMNMVDADDDMISVIMEIVEAPTVDPVKRGHWIIDDWQKSDGVYPNPTKKCSRCFRACHITQIPWDTVYCPWCGAFMDEKD